MKRKRSARRGRRAKPLRPRPAASKGRTEPAVPSTWAPVVAATVWGIIGALACLSVSGLEPNLVEEGFVVHVAQRMVAGEHLYRDIVFF